VTLGAIQVDRLTPALIFMLTQFIATPLGAVEIERLELPGIKGVDDRILLNSNVLP